jgi:hypothetical protein
VIKKSLFGVLLALSVAMHTVFAADATTAAPNQAQTPSQSVTIPPATPGGAPIIINNNVVQAPPPQPAPTPAPPVYIQVPPAVYVQPPQTVYVQPAPPVYVQTPPPAAEPVTHPWDFVTYVWQNFSDHNVPVMTSLCQDRNTNYFGLRHASLDSISRDMLSDQQRYGEWRATYYPDTYWREVSNEYSPRWVGPMIYDHIDMYSEVYENGVRWHRARVRFTVGFTNVGGVTRIYSLTYQAV